MRERDEDERLHDVWMYHKERPKAALLLTGAYERGGKKENVWEGGGVTGTQGYPEPHRWDAARHWKRTDNNK